ncbi:pre-RNA processing PIH1/Nop17-domain-containing protein [Ostreococcus tauri]|uniref:Pre-RNA processing PIH1/Nop17-domain-containing protein n=1 Tax=Ostreococcus tauri TaxID=70448 RepID=A0A1Y5IG48_OSTTA|nr:pre-RNA processing PIH1/Nop17-domain-containing protein [Ostreococcus tauri]
MTDAGEDVDVGRVRELCEVLSALVDGDGASGPVPDEAKAFLDELVNAFPVEGMNDEEKVREVMKLVREAASGGLERVDGGTSATTTAMSATRTVELEPKFVVKTLDATGTKVFVNVCASEFVDVPDENRESWSQGLMHKSVPRALERTARESAPELRFPFSCGDARIDVDSSGQPAVVYDVVFNSFVLRHAEVYKPLRRFVAELSLRRVAEKHAHTAQISFTYKLPARLFIGAAPPPPQRIRVDPKSLVSPVSEGDATNGEKVNVCERIQHELEYVGQPVTAAKLRVFVPPGRQTKDVRVFIVREGLEVSIAGSRIPPARFELPFMLESNSAKGRIKAATRDVREHVEYEVQYLPYKLAVERCE